MLRNRESGYKAKARRGPGRQTSINSSSATHERRVVADGVGSALEAVDASLEAAQIAFEIANVISDAIDGAILLAGAQAAEGAIDAIVDVADGSFELGEVVADIADAVALRAHIAWSPREVAEFALQIDYAVGELIVVASEIVDRARVVVAGRRDGLTRR